MRLPLPPGAMGNGNASTRQGYPSGVLRPALTGPVRVAGRINQEGNGRIYVIRFP